MESSQVDCQLSIDEELEIVRARHRDDLACLVGKGNVSLHGKVEVVSSTRVSESFVVNRKERRAVVGTTRER